MANTYISSGQTSSGIVVNRNEYCNISSGGTAIDTTVNNGGIMHLSGGVASRTTLSSGASMSFYSGWAYYTELENGGQIHLKNSNSYLYYTSAYGRINAWDGKMNSTTVFASGFVNLSSAQASNTTVNSSGSFVVCEGTASFNTVNSGGRMIVYSGVANTTSLNKGSFLVSEGGIANYTSVGQDGYFGVNDGTASRTTVNVGTMFVNSNGIANSVTVNSGGVLYVENKSSLATDVTLNDGATMHIYYASAYRTVINSGGWMSLSAGVISSVTVKEGGTLLLHTGSASGIVEDGGCVVMDGYTDTSIIPHSFSGIKLGSGKSATVHSGTTANSTTINSGGQLTAYECGIVNSTTVNSGGTFGVYENGSANDTVLNKGGAMYLYGIANRVTISSGGECHVLNGTLNDAVVSKGGILDFDSLYKGRAIRTTINSGVSVTVFQKNVMDSTTVNSMGSMAVSSGGIASRTTLSGGKLEVYSGGSAVGGVVGSNGGMYVYTSGVASNMSVASRGLFYISGGSADGIAVSSGGTLSIRYGKAYNTTLSGGLLALSGGHARYAIVEAGMVNVSSGSWADGLAVSSGGTVQVFRGGVVNGIDSYSGSLYVSSGGRATGRMYFLGDSVVSFDDGSMLNFDISIFSPGGMTACVNDLSFVTGTPDYMLTVWASQEEGKYKLANNASGFNRTVTVKDAEGTSLGTLKVGQTAKLGGVDYRLDLGGDNVLSVSVGAAAPSGPAKGDIDGNGISDVMFIWTGNNYAHGYWMNGTSEWQSANSNHPAEWDNLGCYDMTGDGKADSVLFGNVTSEAGIHGAYIGYYADAIDNPDGSTWVNIGYLTNEENIDWKNKVGNLTGNASGVNSIVWYAPELYALGVWTDGTENWATLSKDFGGDAWTLVGCGDFDGDGKDSVLMSYMNGQMFYSVGIDGVAKSLGGSNWSGWEVRAVGDFAGDGKDDLVLFHKDTGSMVMCADGSVDSYVSLAQLDPGDWFIAGCGDYNGDQKDDLLVRQYSTGMLGYYSSGDTAQWNVLGYGVDMSWTVIA